MATWEEIKRLAADFQRTQESDTLQRLSERNCIDIVKKLTELNLIELVYTCDGREFITPAHLSKEIEDEVYINGGRVHLHDLATNLNVDYQHVENRAKELAKEHSEYTLILGQIIHSNYKTTLGKQIQDTMLFHGQLNTADLAKTLDLPLDFLLTIVPTVIDDFVVSEDKRTYYTTDMMNRYKAIVAGTLTAVSKPTSMASIMKRIGLNERLFTPIVDGLVKEGRIDATVENKQFIPSAHAREQNEWAEKFYELNSYIEYDVLARMDMKKKKFQDGLALKTCFVGSSLISQAESLIDDSIASNSWIDIATVLPPAIQPEDIEVLIGDIYKKNRQFAASSLLFNQTIVCSLGFIAKCKESFVELMPKTAQDHLNQGRLVDYFLDGKDPKPIQQAKASGTEEPEQKQQQQDQVQSTPKEKETKKDKDVDTPVSPVPDPSMEPDEPTKKSKSRKSGGGAQGREIKQRAVKKKYLPGNKGRKSRRSISPDERPGKEVAAEKEPLIFMSTDKIAEKLKKNSHHDDSLEQLMDIIAAKIESDLNTTYKTIARQTLDEYLKSLEENQEPEEENDSEVEIIE